jgi:hypothetical protein
MRVKLTPHQREVFDRLTRVSGRNRRWVAFRYIGSRGALNKLVSKGYVESLVEYGPRGGERWSFRPIEEAS